MLGCILCCKYDVKISFFIDYVYFMREICQCTDSFICIFMGRIANKSNTKYTGYTCNVDKQKVT